MKVVVTGGGTGGHIYPALTVADELKARRADLTYLGSLRGQEAEACRKAGIAFEGFPSAPLYSLKTPAGWRSLIALLRARGMAKQALDAGRPDVVFSTGGYSAGPVVAAARSLRIPYVIHEANSVPGRSNLIFAKGAYAFTTVFRCTERHVRGFAATRTGQPIRKELRAACRQNSESDKDRQILVLGGSQGSEFLNEAMPQAARLLSGVRFIHGAGRANIGAMGKRTQGLAGYDARPYLEADELVHAYRRSMTVVARSGGTLAELAMFGLPSILVPLPTSADDHQLHNAEEFADMNAATLLRQEAATPEAIATAIQYWLETPAAREVAKRAMREWDVPDATERIASIVQEAAGLSHA